MNREKGARKGAFFVAAALGSFASSLAPSAVHKRRTASNARNKGFGERSVASGLAAPGIAMKPRFSFVSELRLAPENASASLHILS